MGTQKSDFSNGEIGNIKLSLCDKYNEEKNVFEVKCAGYAGAEGLPLEIYNDVKKEARNLVIQHPNWPNGQPPRKEMGWSAETGSFWLQPTQ